MTRKLAIAIMVLVLSVYGGVSASTSAVSSDPLDADWPDGAPGAPRASARTNLVVQVQAVSPSVPAPERALSANPLWAIPLARLAITRDRPIFSPSRRPPPPVVAPVVVPQVAAAPPPREPERPQFSLVGTVASDDEGFGIFVDQATSAVFRLKVGADYQGWKLRSVQGRGATLEKGQQIVPLTLPEPSAGQLAIEVPPPPAIPGRLLSVKAQPRPDDRSGR
jgi:general secretion pathway protein N